MPKSKIKEKKKYICHDCGISLSSPYNLKVHIQSKCSTEKNYICETCDSRFLTIHSLKTHINSIHVSEKNFVCSHCAKSFSSKGQLIVHERTHNKQKPFVCCVCNRAFSHRESLVTHSTLHTKIKPYACENCSLTFSCVGNLIKHRKIRPTTCGLPIFTNKKICKRAGVKLEKGKSSIIIVDPNPIDTTEQSHDQIFDASDNIALREEEIIIDNQPIESQNNHFAEHQFITTITENPNQPTITDIQIIEDYSRKEMDVFDFIGIEIRNIQEQEERERKIQFENAAKQLQQQQQLNDDNDELMVMDQLEEAIIEDEEHVEFIEDVEELIEEENNFDDEYGSDSQELYENDDEISRHEENEGDEDNEILEYIDVSNENEFKCKLCPKIYQKRNISINHLKKEHQIVIKSFNYDIANRYRKPQKNQKWKCRYCAKKYISAKTVESHEKNHGVNGKLIHKCSCCSMYFGSVEEMENHQYSAHSDRLICDVQDCLKQFDHPNKLLNHRKYTHSANKIQTKKYSFVCTLCGRNFNTRVALSDHERSNCGKNPIYRCQYCDKNYNSAGSLKTHLTIHTAELNYCCTFCAKKFRTKGQLTVHNRSHLNIKAFKCKFENCNSEFAYRESLLTHLTTHTGIKRFECENCSARFSCISNLLAHRRSRRKKTDCSDSKIRKVENAYTSLKAV